MLLKTRYLGFCVSSLYFLLIYFWIHMILDFKKGTQSSRNVSPNYHILSHETVRWDDERGLEEHLNVCI